MSVSVFHRELRRDRWRLFAMIAIAALVLALLLDGLAYELISFKWQDEGEGGPKWKLEQSQFYQFLRLVGFVPVWLAVAIGVDLASRRRANSGLDRGGARAAWVTPGMLVCTVVTGAVVALLKALIGRERPSEHDGELYFKSLFEGFVDGSNLATPSSHAAIAFAGALVISRLRPGTGLIALPLAAGCAYTRVRMGAHFLSDVVLGAIVAWMVVEMFLPRDRYPAYPTRGGGRG